MKTISTLILSIFLLSEAHADIRYVESFFYQTGANVLVKMTGNLHAKYDEFEAKSAMEVSEVGFWAEIRGESVEDWLMQHSPKAKNILMQDVNLRNEVEKFFTEKGEFRVYQVLPRHLACYGQSIYFLAKDLSFGFYLNGVTCE